jgi:glycosyltransferase involved in cell wall biosynthesis
MTLQPRKKVLYLITKSNWGGAQRYVYDLATNLDRAQFEPVVALGGDGPLREMLHNAGVRTIHLSEMKNSTSLKQSWRAFLQLRQIVNQEAPAVFHLNSSVAGLLGAFVGRMNGVSHIVFTAHGWAFNEDRPLWQRVIIKNLHWLTVLLSHRTIAVSSAIVSQMNWPFVQNKMKIINPGRTIGPMYNRDEARSKITDFYPELASYISNYWIVCIAELHPIKRHHVLLEAFATRVKTDPLQTLIVIGEGAERKNIEDQITALGLTKNVFLLGNIVEAARFLKAFDVFTLVSKSESYGYVLHEAGLAFVPIIATNVGGIPDIISEPTEGLLITPDSVTSLVTALANTYNNPSEAHNRADTLRAKLEARSVTKMTKQTESLYTN